MSDETPVADFLRFCHEHVTVDGKPLDPALMAMTVTTAEQEHQADLRRRSYELVLQRGHVIRR